MNYYIASTNQILTPFASEKKMETILPYLVLTSFILLSLVTVWFICNPPIKCRKCGSRKTFNWEEKTEDVSHPNRWHVNENQYCFRCAEFTIRDKFADITSTLRYWFAIRHYYRHHNQGSHKA